MTWILAGTTAFFFYLWLKSEADRASEQCEYRVRVDRLRREIEAEFCQPESSETLFQAACAKAREEDAVFEASVLDDIERL